MNQRSQPSTEPTANLYLTLFNNNLLDKKILRVFRETNGNYESILKDCILNFNICFPLYCYGYQHSLYYEISLSEFFSYVEYINTLNNIYPFYLERLLNINIDEISIDKFKYKIYKYIFKNKEKEFYETDEGYKELEKINRIKNKRKIKNYKKQVAYILKDSNTGFYKIGRSSNPLEREKTLQAEKPTLKLIKTFKNNIETELQNKYKTQKIRGEWFKLTKVQLHYICKNYK